MALKAEKILATVRKGDALKKAAPDAQDLGWRTKDTLPALFADQLKNMKTGDVAGPLQAPNGFHIIQLEGVQGGNTEAPTKEMIQNIAYQIAFQQAVKTWLIELRKTAYVKIV